MYDNVIRYSTLGVGFRSFCMARLERASRYGDSAEVLEEIGRKVGRGTREVIL